MSTLFVSVEDLLLEGEQAVCARALGWGVNNIAVSLAYHAARDIAPHSGLGAITRADGIHFVPQPDAFQVSGLVPRQLQADAAIPDRVLAAAAEYDLGVLGWAVFLHNEELGARFPQLTQQNAYGATAAHADLCPSQNRVRAYCVELALAIAETGVETVIAESLHFGAFGHGYHHERDMVGLGPVEQFVMGLCFCEPCERNAAQRGVNVAAARTAVRDYLDPILGGEAAPSHASLRITEAGLRETFGRELASFVSARQPTVTSLIAMVSAALADRGVRLEVLDLTGAHQGYGDGLPPAVSGVDEAWQLGLDLAAVASHADIGILAYARDPKRVESETERYLAAIARGGAALHVLLRPGLPDTETAEQLAEKVALVQRVGATPDFYHYGLYSMPVLERIGGALAERV